LEGWLPAALPNGRAALGPATEEEHVARFGFEIS
jgi:hypothetical protein